VNELVATGLPAALTRVASLSQSTFPHASPSAATAAFSNELAAALKSSSNNSGNSTVSAAIDTVSDEVNTAIATLQSLERWIQLSTPQMEDGNNFGVSVQMVVAKELADIRKELSKITGGFVDYYEKRAGAFDKISNLSIESKSTASSESESAGGKDGEEKKTSKSVSTDVKMSTREDIDRLKAVVAVDVKWYSELKAAMTELFNTYVIALDVVEKNFLKLSEPKGSSGGRNYDNMY